MCIKTKNLPHLNNDTFFIKHKGGTKHKIIHLLDFGGTIELFEINHI